MMKSRTFLVIAIGLLILGTALFTFSRRNQEPEQIYPATINRDCAPWDGAAFTVSIPYDSGSVINISIWQSPDIKLPSTFSFPDETGQIGFAYTLPELDPLEELTGKVTFWRVGEERPVDGEFSLMSERGERFSGKFKAKWGDEIVYCG
jgi:hypothetical protein